MKKWALFLIFSAISLFANYTAQPIDAKIIHSNIKIIDIRTPAEWQSTGIIKNSIPIMFFDERGNYNMEAFLGQLNRHVKKGERFALICHSGNRSSMLGMHLGEQMNYNVIDLLGGIQSAVAKKIPLVPYKPKH